ncbi:MAG TPA: hypothetical protein VF185_01780 [Patescibacteria group bacterium]
MKENDFLEEIKRVYGFNKKNKYNGNGSGSTFSKTTPTLHGTTRVPTPTEIERYIKEQSKNNI